MRRNAGALPQAAQGLEAAIAAHLARAKDGDYVALLAYVARNPRPPRDPAGGPRARCATRAASRPASNSGRASCTPPARPTRAAPIPACSCRSPPTRRQDLAIPGRSLGFGTVVAAQARGDFAVLAERGRRALRVHIKGGDVEAGLKRIAAAIRAAL